MIFPRGRADLITDPNYPLVHVGQSRVQSGLDTQEHASHPQDNPSSILRLTALSIPYPSLLPTLPIRLCLPWSPGLPYTIYNSDSSLTPHPPMGTDGNWRRLSARAPPGVWRWRRGGGPSELGCVWWCLGWGKDSAPGRRCAVRAGPPAGVWSGPGSGPLWRGGGPGRSSEVGGSCFPPARRDVLEKLRSRVRAAGEGQQGLGGPQGSPHAAGPPWGPTLSGAPWRGGGGRKRAVGANPEEGRWSAAPQATSGLVELRPLARGRRGGREALVLTSRGPAGDGGSGHSTPHRPPPAPADSGVRRQCARGGASQLRGRGSGREPRETHVGLWVGRWLRDRLLGSP